MRLLAAEEYGLRCMLQLCRLDSGQTMTIPQLSKAEGMSASYVGRIVRELRLAGLVHATRGQAGGYRLSRPGAHITVSQVLRTFDGELFGEGFCQQHSGSEADCVHRGDCAISTLWLLVNDAIGDLLQRITLDALICRESTLLESIASNSAFVLPLNS